MFGLPILNIVVGTTRENRVETITRIITQKGRNGRTGRAVVGYTTGAPASEADAQLFRFVLDDKFTAMERRGDFAHTDEANGIRYGYRFVDIEQTLQDSDALVIFNQFDEPLDRSALALLKCIKRVVNPHNETQTLSLTAYGDLRLRDRPTN